MGEPGLEACSQPSLQPGSPLTRGGRRSCWCQLLCLPLAVLLMPLLAQGKVGEAQKRTQAWEDPIQGETERLFCSRHGIIWVLGQSEEGLLSFVY